MTPDEVDAAVALMPMRIPDEDAARLRRKAAALGVTVGDPLTYGDARAVDKAEGEAALVALLAEHKGRGTLPADTLVSHWSRYGGRNAGPDVLDLADRAGCLSPAALAECLPAAWSGAEWPEDVLGRERWVALWRSPGYSEAGVLVPQPTAPVVLYRGATEDRATGLAWTTERSVAEWFAGRFADLSDEVLTVWRCEVPGDRLLGTIGAAGREGEAEVVADVEGLAVEAVGEVTGSDEVSA